MVIPRVNYEKVVVTKYRGAVPQDGGQGGGGGASGSLTIKDCDGGTQAVLEWVNGRITSTGSLEATGGCESGGTPGGS